MDWSKCIKKLRNNLLVTQSELAKILGVSFASINRWENGHHEPTMSVKRKIRQLCLEHDIDIRNI